MFDTLGTTTSLSPTTTYAMPTTTALGSTDFTLNDDGSINKSHAATTLGSTGTVASTTLFEEAEHEAVLRKYTNACVTERYIESLSDEEIESALEKLGLLEEKFNENSTIKTI